jgi:hypothetical protein
MGAPLKSVDPAARVPIVAPEQFPLSYAQETMLFWDRLVPHSSVYNVPVARQILGPLDIEALRKTIRLIVSRHVVLHTNFLFVRGEPTQIVGSPDVDLSIIDLSGTSETQRPSALKERLSAEAQRPFDLSKDPMLRALLIRLSPEEHVLMVTMHHIASDGWSVGIVLRELLEAYPEFAAGKTPQLPELPVQYRHFAKWQRDLLQGPTLDRLLTFWKQQLAGAPDSPELLPLKRARPAQQTFEGATVQTALPNSFASGLAELGQARRASVFMVMLAALQALLSRYSGAEDICLGVPVANRARPEFVNLIGCFMNTVVVRSNLSGNPTFLELLGRVRETSLAALFHPELPFSELVRHLRPKRSASHTPYFQIQMMFQNYPNPTLSWPGVTVRPVETDTASSKFDLSVIVEQAEKFEMAFEYNAALFDQATMQHALDGYKSVLEQVLRNPQVTLHDLAVKPLPCSTPIPGTWQGV